MEERYHLEGDQRQTDEFMKPIILNKEGLIKGTWYRYARIALCREVYTLAVSYHGVKSRVDRYRTYKSFILNCHFYSFDRDKNRSKWYIWAIPTYRVY